MHETYRYLVQDRIAELMREAADWHRAAEGRGDGTTRQRLVARLRALMPHVGDQAPAAPATTGLAADACRP